MQPILDEISARHARAALDVEAKLASLIRVLKYAEDQPRVPAGGPDGGQWTSGDASGVDALAQPLDDLARSLSTILLAGSGGGFGKEDMGKTVQQFISEKCNAQIYSVFPGQFLEWTLEDLLKANKQHDRAAQRCYKLLGQGRFRK